MDTSAFTDGEWWLLVLALLLMTLVVGGVGFAILQSAKYPQPTMLVMSLSLLTMLIVATYVVSEQEDLLTLTGVGLGALAGAVNAMFVGNPSAKGGPEPPEVGTDGERKEDVGDGSDP